MARFIVPPDNNCLEIYERRFDKANLFFHYFGIAADPARKIWVNERHFRTQIGEIDLIIGYSTIASNPISRGST